VVRARTRVQLHTHVCVCARVYACALARARVPSPRWAWSLEDLPSIGLVNIRTKLRGIRMSRVTGSHKFCYHTAGVGRAGSRT
jgi:hypothetical protein